MWREVKRPGAVDTACGAAHEKESRLCLGCNGSGASTVFLYVRTSSVLNDAAPAPYRGGAGRLSVLVAALAAIAVAAGVSAALTVARIHAGTAAAGGNRVTVASAPASASFTAPGAKAAAAETRG